MSTRTRGYLGLSDLYNDYQECEAFYVILQLKTSFRDSAKISAYFYLTVTRKLLNLHFIQSYIIISVLLLLLYQSV
jgi:hypothetical protein